MDSLPLSHDFMRLIFYDTVGKGGGVAAKAFDYGEYTQPFHLYLGFSHRFAAHETLRKAHFAIENCRCEGGCTKCI